MSSYLSFYLVPKKKEGQTEENKPILLSSHSRNSNIYQAFNDNLSIAYIGNDEEDHYTELSYHMIKDYVIDDLLSDIKSLEKRINTTYKLCPPCDRHEVVNELIENEEYLEELQNTLRDIYFICNIVSDTNNGYNGFEKVLCNID